MLTYLSTYHAAWIPVIKPNKNRKNRKGRKTRPRRKLKAKNKHIKNKRKERAGMYF
jgi:hypothetical protein